MSAPIRKKEAFDAIQKILKDREEVALRAMEEAQNSANSEEKSSAGDKYETGRAMAQNQKDMNQRQLFEIREALLLLEKNDRNGPFQLALPGSLVYTEGGTYFMGPGLGKLVLTDGRILMSISQNAPLGALLLGKKVGDVIDFQGRKIRILNIE